MDVIIPLGSESFGGRNDELRLLLRSIDRHLLDAGRVIVVSDCAPGWLSDDVAVLRHGDPMDDNKDANLIDKTLAAVELFGLEEFVWCADDNVFLSDVSAACIPLMANPRPRERFTGSGKWHARVRHTFELADTMGVSLPFILEPHAPQTFRRIGRRFADDCRSFRYWEGAGYTIMTFFRLVLGEDPAALETAPRCDLFKETYETEEGAFRAKLRKAFCGYNDTGFGCGLRDRLFERFPDKSRFEK